MLRQKINTLKRRSYKLFNKLFIYLLVDILIYLRNFLRGVFIPEKRLIIFRHDGIGDYVLFRNFLEVLKKSPRFAGYKITLLGNAAWKELAEFLDKDHIDEFIWLDKKRFAADFLYRYKKFKEITSVKYEILIHPFGREFFNADNDLACLINADKKIGSIRLPRFTKPYKKKILEKIYNELIPDVENVWFEFYKNKNFFEKLLSEKISIDKPFIKLPPHPAAASVSAAASAPAPALSEEPGLKSKLGISSPYAAFFIGASVKHRKWPPEYFAETARYIHTKYGFHIVLCGGKSELSDAAEFKKHFPADLADKASLTDAVGKISLIELLYIVKNASLVISNETMAPHIAMALANEGANANEAKPAVIVISTGEASYGHFSPYPEEMGGGYNYTEVFHPYIEKNLKEYIDITAAFGRGYDDGFDISEIKVKTLTDKLDKLYKLTADKF